VQQVASKVLPSVVSVVAVAGNAQSEGSGIVLTSSGLILTNEHVIDGASKLTVQFNDGTTANATVVGADPTDDLAVIKVSGMSGLTPATLGSSSNLQVGQQVVAVGSPLGLSATVTTGIVSALNRPVRTSQAQSEQAQGTVLNAIQTDAAINPGNSGGPLVDMNGYVIGINSAIAALSSGSNGQAGSIGVGFAIPIDQAHRIAQEIIDTGKASHAVLGASVTDNVDQSRGVTTGAKIADITPNSGAAKAGLQAGDVVTKVGGTLIESADALVATIRSTAPGSKVTVTYLRGGQPATVERDARIRHELRAALKGGARRGPRRDPGSDRGQPEPLDLGLQSGDQPESGVIPALAQPVRQQPVTSLGEHRLGVELHAGDGVPSMTKSHDGAVDSPCGDLDLVRKCAVHHGEGVVPGRGEGVRQPVEERRRIVPHLRGAPVHQLGGAVHDSAVDLGDRLMPETHAEHRGLGLGGPADERLGDAGIRRDARAGREQHAVRSLGRHLVNGDGIVAPHPALGAELLQVLHQVVDERVVVVDHHNASHGHQPSTCRSARRIGRSKRRQIKPSARRAARIDRQHRLHPREDHEEQQRHHRRDQHHHLQQAQAERPRQVPPDPSVHVSSSPAARAA
jgi:putative serine protease PepD